MYLSTLVSEELPSVVDDLFVREVGVWLLLTNAQHLPQCDAESPHVTGCGELTLWTHNQSPSPTNWMLIDRIWTLSVSNYHKFLITTVIIRAVYRVTSLLVPVVACISQCGNQNSRTEHQSSHIIRCTHTFLSSHHEYTLPSHPAYWQHSSALNPVVVSCVQVPAHAKVSNLDVTLAAPILPALTLLTSNQTVTSGQIPVHKVERGEELHSWCNLAGHGDEGWVTEYR